MPSFGLSTTAVPARAHRSTERNMFVSRRVSAFKTDYRGCPQFSAWNPSAGFSLSNSLMSGDSGPAVGYFRQSSSSSSTRVVPVVWLRRRAQAVVGVTDVVQDAVPELVCL